MFFLSLKRTPVVSPKHHNGHCHTDKTLHGKLLKFSGAVCSNHGNYSYNRYTASSVPFLFSISIYCHAPQTPPGQIKGISINHFSYMIQQSINPSAINNRPMVRSNSRWNYLSRIYSDMHNGIIWSVDIPLMCVYGIHQLVAWIRCCIPLHPISPLRHDCKIFKLTIIAKI